MSSHTPEEGWRAFGLDEEHFATIGKIAAPFGAIEFFASMMLLTLIGSEAWPGRLVVGGEGLSWQLERIHRLAPHRLDADLASDVDAWRRRVRAASAERNRILHGSWHYLEDQGELQKLAFRRGQMEQPSFALPELQIFGDELVVLFLDTLVIYGRVLEVLRPDVGDEREAHRLASSPQVPSEEPTHSADDWLREPE